MTEVFTVVIADGHDAYVGGIGPVNREQHHPALRRTARRLLVLVVLAALALPVSAPGAGAAQPGGSGNAHLAPRAALTVQILPRDDQPAPAGHGTAWLPLAVLVGLLLAGGGVLYVRRRAT
ncbi:MAG TPA: LPXTG cell wall anchor domain-containing protein [Amycolatopsis sp.]|nr:LPXTG cell wall anchor domain-containing protein [Amycolatopsis sp.]